MPRFNGLAQAVMGRSSGPASVDGTLVVNPGGGPASPISNTEVLVNSNARTGVWETVKVEVASGVMRRMGNTANTLVAGGGRWLGWANGAGLFVL